MKRALPALFALGLITLAGLLVMPKLNEATSRAVSAGLAGLRGRIEDRLGLSFSFDALSPSILRSASFSRLAITAPGGRTILSARKMRVRYDFFALACGKGSVLSGLDLSDVNIDLRLPEDEALLGRLSSLFSGGGGPMPKIVVSGENVTANISAEGLGAASFVARNIGFSTVEEEPSVVLEGRFSLTPTNTRIGQISGPLSVSGSLARDFKRARVDLSAAAESRDFSLKTQRFELVYGDDELVLTKIKDRSPLDAVVRLSFAGKESSISFKMDGYTPSRSLRLMGGYASFESWFELPYTGSLTLKAPGLNLSAFSYEADLSGSLPGRLIPGGGGSSARASIAFKGDGRSLSVNRLRIERGDEFLSYAGSFRFADLAPDGVVDLRFSPVEGAPEIASSIRIFGQGGEYAALADELSVSGATFKDIAVTAAHKGDQLDFNLSFRPPSSSEAEPKVALPVTSFSGEAGASQAMSLIRCEGSATLGSSPSLELSLDFESLDLGPLKELLAAMTDNEGTASILSSFKLGGSAFATSDFKRLSWTASDLTLVSRLVPGAYALLSLSGTTTSVQIKRALVSVSGYSVEGSGKLDFSDAKRLLFESQISLKDIPYSLRGSVTQEGLFINGDYGLSLSARREGKDTEISAKMRGLPLPVAGGIFLTSMDLEGRFASIDDWDAELGDLALVPTGEQIASLPKVEIAGSFAPSKARLSKIDIEDRFSSLLGTGDLRYSLGDSPSASLSATLAAAALRAEAQSAAVKTVGALPSESYKVDLSYSKGRCEGIADFVASPLARLGKFPLSGSVDGRVAISGPLFDPSVDFSLSLRDGGYLDQSLVLSIVGTYVSQLIELQDLSGTYQGQTISGGKGRFSLADASGEIALRFAGSFGGKSLSFSLDAKGSSGKEGKGDLDQMLSHYSISGELGSLTYGTSVVGTWPFSISSTSSSIAVVGGASSEVKFRYFENGIISASLRSPFPILADLSGLYDGKKVDLSVQDLACDMSLVSQFLPPDLVRITTGKAHGGFSAIGLASDPEITGEIDLEGVTVKVPGWIMDEIGPFSTSIVARGRKIDFSVARAAIGRGFMALDGQGTFDHWLPSGLTLSARNIAGSTTRIDATIMGIRAKGDASIALKMAFQGDILAIDTDIFLEKATVLVSQEALGGGGGSGPMSPSSLYFQVAANVHFGRAVQASFSPMSIPILTGYTDPSSVLAINYDQASDNFSLKGTLGLRGGEVFYGQRDFFLKSGKVVFNEGEGRFDPRVTLLAELRDSNEDGPVVISLRTDNAPISSFTPVLSSDPVLTQAQIMAILGLGSSTDGSSLDMKKVFIAGSELIPQLNVTHVVEDKLRDFTGLDIIYLQTQALGQWLADVAGQSPASTFGQYFDQSELYVGKYLTDSIFLHGSVSLQEVSPLAGFDSLKIYSELGVEMDAPFGRLTWTLTPDNGWNNLQVGDQSLSMSLGLSWRISY